MKKQVKPKVKNNTEENIMRKIRIEKVILSCGATAQDLEKAKKLLEYLTGKHAHKIASTKRIPDFGVRPGLEVGTRVTLRGEHAISILKKLLGAIDNVLSEDQIRRQQVARQAELQEAALPNRFQAAVQAGCLFQKISFQALL